ncbi:MAG: 4-hydroxy-tetrahydrodipicolinate reductase [Phormidesmis sp. FL-bin-119]|nr:4-hydroxy-tetrahydrodipicolinate reductase [Pedobacter sp.]
MKIAILGFGKMGQIIEQFAMERGHDVVLKVNADNLDELTISNLKNSDVAIDFSTPDCVLQNIALCFDAGVAIVVGTTGWYGRLQEVKNQCIEGNNTLLYASNFSVGVNVFFFINRVLAKIMNRYPQYEVQVEEIHHTEKLDSPSGTAMSIAEGIIGELNRKNEWVNELIGSHSELITKPDHLLIESHRIEDVPGTHTVIYSSEVDDIEFKHKAHSRAGFALGAVLAAEWVHGKNGFYNVTDMFDFSV